MISHTDEGIDLLPIYTEENLLTQSADLGVPGEAPYRRGTTVGGSVIHPWLVAQEFPYATAGEANAALRDDMSRGQTAVYLPLDRATRLGLDADKTEPSCVGLGGLSVASVEDLGTALGGIDLASTPVHLDADLGTPAVAAMLVACADRSGVPADHLHGALTADPIGLLLIHGALSCGLSAAFDRMHLVSLWAAKHAPALRTIGVRSAVTHDAGADAVQELACSMATGLEYLRAMIQRGMPVDDAAQQIWFSLSSGSRFFMEVAKFRAARMLWATIVQAFGGSPPAQQLRLHVRTSAFTMSAVDPYVNVLRTTTEALAGAISGCNSIHVGFFDEAVRQPDEFSRRIARNTQVILQSEAHLRKVIDPAGGSWFIETLTDQIVAAAWTQVQEIESAGGMVAAVMTGIIQARIGRSAARRADGIARRQETIVGVTAFANAAETPLDRRGADPVYMGEQRANDVRSYRTQRDSSGSAAAIARIPRRAKEGPAGLMAGLIDAARQGATVGELIKALPPVPGDEPVTTTPLPATRKSAPFEALRNAMHARAQESGHPLRVYLAPMGPVAQHKARADFAAGFFAVAGCEVITPDGFASAEDAAHAACASGAEITVLCSTDDRYPALVPLFCAAVRAVRDDLTIVLAGYPQDYIEAFRAAGVDDFIHLRANVLETLRSLLARKGVHP
jgi:methylmalonyl-CoA mutase